jgi:tRNA threonylcarbamoyladenosine biosynthesis protein TsaB
VLLAFDTATAAVTVALHDGERVVASSTTVDAMRHGELLAPAVTALLDEAWIRPHDVTAVAVGVGPGPFTGLRVGLVTARTMALALSIPVYGVCTLDVLAAGCGLDEPFVVATDARRKEVYWASYDEHGQRIDGPHVDRPAEVSTELPVVGRGALLFPDAFPRPAGPEYPSAGVLAAVVTEERVELYDPDPLYLRRPDVMAAGKPKRVT